MSIQNPIVSAGATSRKTKTQTTVCPVIEADGPPNWIVVKQEEGETVIEQYNPQWKGQMMFVKKSDLQTVIIYIVVDAGDFGDLIWVPVRPAGTITDPRTGKPKDPYYDLY
jgi:hypothetical protein